MTAQQAKDRIVEAAKTKMRAIRKEQRLAQTSFWGPLKMAERDRSRAEVLQIEAEKARARGDEDAAQKYEKARTVALFDANRRQSKYDIGSVERLEKAKREAERLKKRKADIAHNAILREAERAKAKLLKAIEKLDNLQLALDEAQLAVNEARPAAEEAEAAALNSISERNKEQTQWQ